MNTDMRLQTIWFPAKTSIKVFIMPSNIQNKIAVSPAWVTQVIYSPNKWILEITFGTTVVFCFWSLDIYLFIINAFQHDAPIKIVQKETYIPFCIGSLIAVSFFECTST